MDDAILDASAMLALVLGEPGAEVVAACPRPIISTVNYAEVVTKLLAYGVAEELLRQMLAHVDVTLVPFDHIQAVEAGLIPVDKRYPLSLGDRACITLAHLRGMPVLTTDSNWTKLALPVQVVLIRPRNDEM